MDLALRFSTRCATAYHRAGDRTRRILNAAVLDEVHVRDGRVSMRPTRSLSTCSFLRRSSNTTMWWTLWDGFQTLPNRWNRSLTREHRPFPPKGNASKPRTEPFGPPKSGDPAEKGRLSNPVQRRLSAHEIDGLARLYREGATIDALVRRYGVHRTTVIAHLDRRGVPRRWVPLAAG
jgi:hypothetical protein